MQSINSGYFSNFFLRTIFETKKATVVNVRIKIDTQVQ